MKSLRDPDDQPTYCEYPPSIPISLIGGERANRPTVQNYNGIGYYNHVFGTMLYLTAYLDKSAPLNFETKERCPLSTRAISEFGSITVDSNLTYRYGDNFQSKWKACLDGNGWGVPARYIPVWDSMDSIKVNQPGDLKKCIKIDVKVTAATGSRQVII